MSKVAKNSLALYLRMFFAMIISFYSSRIIINALGEVNYGVYVVVGGVIGMLSFLNTTMSGAISRFINYDIGKGVLSAVNRRVSSAFMLQLGIAVIFVVASETIGLWFVNTHLNIPPDRMIAANWLYQISILISILSLVQVPYTSLILSYEKMGFYAIVEIIHVVLKLACAFAIYFCGGDQLIMYGGLLLVVQLAVFILYAFGCFKYMPSLKIRFHRDFSHIKPMLVFSGWDLYGNVAYTGMLQGATILINIFFGPIVNAAGGITMTLSSQVAWFGRNVTMAYRPQIINNYAQGNIHTMNKLMSDASKYGLMFLLLVTVPLYIEVDYVLHLWLGDVPMFTSTFCRIMLIAGCINVVNAVITTSIHATGRIAKLSFYAGSLYILTVPITYVLYELGLPAMYAYITMLVIHVMVMGVNCIILKSLANSFNIKEFLCNTIGKCLLASFIPALLVILIHYNMQVGFIRLLVVVIAFVITYIFSVYYIVLDVDMRSKLINMLLQKIKK